MGFSENLSVRYINALRQLPQYHCNVDRSGPLTHALTGVRVSPTGELHDADDTVVILAVEFLADTRSRSMLLLFPRLHRKKLLKSKSALLLKISEFGKENKRRYNNG